MGGHRVQVAGALVVNLQDDRAQAPAQDVDGGVVPGVAVALDFAGVDGLQLGGGDEPGRRGRRRRFYTRMGRPSR